MTATLNLFVAVLVEKKPMIISKTSVECPLQTLVSLYIIIHLLI